MAVMIEAVPVDVDVHASPPLAEERWGGQNLQGGKRRERSGKKSSEHSYHDRWLMHDHCELNVLERVVVDVVAPVPREPEPEPVWMELELELIQQRVVHHHPTLVVILLV